MRSTWLRPSQRGAERRGNDSAFSRSVSTDGRPVSCPMATQERVTGSDLKRDSRRSLVRVGRVGDVGPMRPIVAFQGETGAFSEAAAEQLVPGPITLLPRDTFDAAVRAVVDGHADFAVLPVSNVIAGPVHAAIDALAQFPSLEHVREQPLTIAVASSLTELFAPKIHKERIVGMLEGYNFIDDSVLAYFKRRLTQAPRDADFALQYVLKNAKTREEQEACVDAVRFKCNVLWVQLDALYNAYVAGNIPPGAFRPET